jgi:ABC-type transport system involved in multi-copper enzyme maturation permease subunit
MSLRRRRIRAIFRKELREYSRDRSLVGGMAVLPLVFMVQPLVALLVLDPSTSVALSQEHVLIYLLGIPTLVPVFVAAYAVVGERQQGTLEPALTTPIAREELLLGKALAALVPSLGIAYGVFALFLVLVAVLTPPDILSALVQGPDLIAQIVFTPLLAIWSIWVGIAVSTRSSDPRTAQQVGFLASLPPVVVVVLIALSVIPATGSLAVGLGALLIVLDVVGWRLVSAAFDRERLITGTG